MKAMLLIAALISTNAIAEEKIKGGIPPETIFETINRAMPMFVECYKKVDPAPTGEIMTKFTIDGSGKVTKASLGKKTLKSPVIESCALDVIKGLLFPAPEGGGTVDVDYPLTFSPAGAVKGTKEATVEKKKKH